MSIYVFAIKKRRWLFWWRFDTLLSNSQDSPTLPKGWQIAWQWGRRVTSTASDAAFPGGAKG